jgi:hypothetical protein
MSCYIRVIATFLHILRDKKTIATKLNNCPKSSSDDSFGDFLAKTQGLGSVKSLCWVREFWGTSAFERQ